MPVVRPAIPSRNESVQSMADGLCDGALEHPLGSLVKQHDLLIFVHRDNGIHRGLQNALEPQVAPEKFSRGLRLAMNRPYCTGFGQLTGCDGSFTLGFRS